MNSWWTVDEVEREARRGEKVRWGSKGGTMVCVSLMRMDCNAWNGSARGGSTAIDTVDYTHHLKLPQRQGERRSQGPRT